ncbi:MAG: class I SAM-dependent methyltransferase [Actinomycetota bacterium]|nr:class I SAM-dependent methyltransferase [Actinomycetota bacterium]
MFSQPKDTAYFDGFNEFLFREVPADARRIVEVGCARGRLGWELKKQRPDRTVIGIEYDPQAAEIARTRLDEVHECDLHTDFPDIEPGSIDCVLFGDVLEHLLDPEAVLRSARRLLTEDGVILVCVPNFTHFSIVKALLRSDPMYQPSGLLDATHIRFFSHATFIKMLLDVGLLPDLRYVIASGGTEHMIPAATPLLEYFGVDPGRALKYLDAYQYIFAGTRIPEPAVAEPTPMSFVACVNDDDQLNSNLLRSPCLAPGTPHQLLTYRGQSSAADGLAAGLAEAEHDLVVLVQQDMYLPAGWDRHFAEQYRAAEAEFGALGVAGLFGLRFRQGELRHVGQIVDRDQLLSYGTGAPAEVDVLDEVLLAVRASSGLRADPALRFHLYGADLCLSAQQAGLTNVVLPAPAFHNSLFAQPDPSFDVARQALLAKWPGIRPLHTNMGQLDTMPAPAPAAPENPGAPANPAAPESPPELARLREELRDVQARLDAVTASRTWRARTALGRYLGRS